jgi:hypothetical protein
MWKTFAWMMTRQKCIVSEAKYGSGALQKMFETDQMLRMAPEVTQIML